MDVDRAYDLDVMGGLGSLGDPVRRRLYEYVARADDPVSRDEAAADAEISRTLAAYHLDKLVEAGLLTASYARPPGRGGPGSGRPAKRYTRSQRELALSVPPRNYVLLAGLLSDAVAADGSGTLRKALVSAARQTGRGQGGEHGADLMGALMACGYRPVPGVDGDIELRNCPFHHLAQRHTELVCGLNQHLVQGVLEATGRGHARALLRPRSGRCCVVVRGGHPNRVLDVEEDSDE